MEQIVLDFAFPTLTIKQLLSMHVQSVSRYVSWDAFEPPATQPNKNITRAEYAMYRGAGIGVVLNFEQGSNDILGGYKDGLKNGKRARDLANLCGHPADRPIIQSIDRGVKDYLFPIAADYQRGFNDGAGQFPQGAYGPAKVLDYLFEHGLITVLWQMGPSDITGNNYQSPNVSMRQCVGPIPCTHSYDVNRIFKADYGQNPKPQSVGYPPAPFILGDDDMSDGLVRFVGYTNVFAYPSYSPVASEQLVGYAAKGVTVQVIKDHLPSVQAATQRNNMKSADWYLNSSETPPTDIAQFVGSLG